MSRTKIVFFGGSKGGVGKSATSHLACLGAVLCNHPAAYVLTDPDRELRSKGRPYEVLDGRQPKQLANILNAVKSSSDGWLIIDGGGNRLAFDLAIADEVDLCIFPFHHLMKMKIWIRFQKTWTGLLMRWHGLLYSRQIFSRFRPRNSSSTAFLSSIQDA